MNKPSANAQQAHDALQGWWSLAGIDVPPAPAVQPRRKHQSRPARQTGPTPAPAQRSAQASAANTNMALRLEAARKAASRADTLDALRAALENFDAGPVGRMARHTVFARGEQDAPLMVIGEAPGREEDAKGLPFVGQSGQLLDRALAAAGLGQQGVYITNAFNWRPPKNRKPTPDELAMTLPFLERHIALKTPRVILLAGASAMQAVLGLSGGITRARGQWHEHDIKNPDGSPSGTTVAVLPTFHPAYLLRAPLAKRLFWHDLQSLCERPSAPGADKT